ncbi:MAG: hypothetical protein FWE03_00300 [Firmicutes bacterium]|nr:hypothetical protein [Bacillota bacterium]
MATTNCTICKTQIKGYGHNASPIAKNGTACDKCNASHIVPTRMALMGVSSPLEAASLVASEVHLIKTIYGTEVAA